MNEAALMAQMLIEELTGFSNTDRLLKGDQLLSNDQKMRANLWDTELRKGRPVQQLTGKCWFGGRQFWVNEQVLIPRPETDELCAWMVAENPEPHLRVLDACSGSGCIAITLALNLHAVEVWGLELSENALAVAQKNALQLGANVNWLQQDLLEQAVNLPSESLDLLVSNPPYIAACEAAHMSATVLDFEPSMALFVPNDDALVFYKSLAREGQRLLKNGGALYAEINERLGDETKQVFLEAGYRQVVLKQDMQGKNRMIKAVKYIN